MSDCILWTRHVINSGYGSQYVGGGKYKLAHRVAYERAKGEIPDGYFVCHTCDVKLCVNPDHLFAALPKENSADMVRKGRHWVPSRRGEKNGRAKLTIENVKAIKRRLAERHKGAKIAIDFDVTPSLISQIKHGRAWVDVVQ